ncbi:MAG TPA: tetratricopeptide repeat protein [Thermohalobaculum sp.]|nr:tetratricopeptide repeat protein [Thermohalobaculum sp.]
MHRFLTATVFAAGLLSGLLAVLPGGRAASDEVENLLALCSDPQTPVQDAMNACRRVAETGRLDARRRALVWLNAGIAAHALGLYTEAVESHSAAIVADPRLSAAFENRALAYEKLNQLNEALTDYAAAISLRPKAPGAYLGRGILMLNHGAPERALPDFGQALELDPTLIAARYNRGLAFLQLEQSELAELDFSDVIGRSPQDAGAYLNRGRARSDQSKETAWNDFDRAIALKPEWAAAWYMRGRFLDAKGMVDEANADFLRAYQLGHADPWLIERIRRMSGQ